VNFCPPLFIHYKLEACRQPTELESSSDQVGGCEPSVTVTDYVWSVTKTDNRFLLSTLVCLFILVINPHPESGSQFHEKSTIWKPHGLNGQHRAVPLTCSQNVTQNIKLFKKLKTPMLFGYHNCHNLNYNIRPFQTLHKKSMHLHDLWLWFWF